MDHRQKNDQKKRKRTTKLKSKGRKEGQPYEYKENTRKRMQGEKDEAVGLPRKRLRAPFSGFVSQVRRNICSAIPLFMQLKSRRRPFARGSYTIVVNNIYIYIHTHNINNMYIYIHLYNMYIYIYLYNMYIYIYI